MGLIYGVLITVSMYVGYMAVSLGSMALTSMLVSFSVLLPLVRGVIFWAVSVNILYGPDFHPIVEDIIDA